MIATHNTYTYQKALNKLFEVFHCFWRCQDLTIKDQYERGVRYFDIRVHRKKDDNWGVCHGLVNVYGGFSDLKMLYQVVRLHFPGAMCRIILEKGSKKDEEIFRKELDRLREEFKDFGEIVHQCIIKKTWKVLYAGKDLKIVDYCYTPILSGKSLWYNITHFKLSTIKRWAKKHNPIITQKMKEDPDTVYFLDFMK